MPDKSQNDPSAKGNKKEVKETTTAQSEQPKINNDSEDNRLLNKKQAKKTCRI